MLFDPRISILRVISRRKVRGASVEDILKYVAQLRKTWKGNHMNHFLDNVVARENLRGA